MTFDRNLLPDPTAYFEEKGLKLIGPSRAKWKTTECKFHGGSHSMRVNTYTGGWVCMSCYEKGGDVLAYEIAATGAEFVQAAKAIGAWVDDGKPHKPQRPAPLSPRAALSVLTFEATFTAVAASNMGKGVALTDVDHARLLVAANRINLLAEAFA
jgi:hypothetical protein